MKRGYHNWNLIQIQNPDKSQDPKKEITTAEPVSLADNELQQCKFDNDEYFFTASTSEITFHLTEEVISNDASHTQSYRNQLDHPSSRHLPHMHDLERNFTKTIVPLTLKEEAEATMRHVKRNSCFQLLLT